MARRKRRKKKEGQLNISGFMSEGGLLSSLAGRKKDPAVPDLYAASFGRQIEQDKNLDISGVQGSQPAHRRLPDLGASGSRQDKNTLDIGGGGQAPREGSAPNIGAARGDPSRRGGTGARARQVPDLSGSGTSAKSAVPDLAGVRGSGRGRGRGRGSTPDIGGSGKRGNEPILGDAKRPPGGDINAGGGRGSVRLKRNPFRRALIRGVQSYVGMRPMSPAEESEFDLFVRRVHQAGYELNGRQVLSWRAKVMNNAINVADLWNGEIGRELEYSYGKKGADLDLAEGDRPKRTYLPRAKEGRREGVVRRFTNWIRGRGRRQ